jgi:hypothetical protein
MQEKVARIHSNSMAILEKVGIRLRQPGNWSERQTTQLNVISGQALNWFQPRAPLNILLLDLHINLLQFKHMKRSKNGFLLERFTFRTSISI